MNFENFINDKEIEMKSNDVCKMINKWRVEEGKSEKGHNTFMRDINREIDALKSLNLIGLYKFVQSTYINEQNKEQPCYIMSKQDILQMGARESIYVRSKIIEYINTLETYIEETGQEEAFRIYRKNGKIVRRNLTDMIKIIYKNPDGIMYAKYTNLVYNTAFGMTAKQLKELKGLSDKDALRDYFTSEELERILTIEDAISSYLKLLSLSDTNPRMLFVKVEEMLEKI